jgi:hypothetical protein
MLQKILGKMQFVFFNAGNPVVREAGVCKEARETKLENMVNFAQEHGLNYQQPMARWMLGKENQ